MKYLKINNHFINLSNWKSFRIKCYPKEIGFQKEEYSLLIELSGGNGELRSYDLDSLFHLSNKKEHMIKQEKLLSEELFSFLQSSRVVWEIREMED